MYKVSEVLVKFLSESMKKWNLWLFCRNTKLCNITVKRGIFQGDSLSPLLFIMSLFPLSEVVLKKSWGYQFKPSVVINHLLYMDDLKLYAKNEEQLHRMIAEVKHYTDRMKMRFGTEKCKIVHIVRGKLKTNSSPFPISQQDCIETLVNKEEQYKYLGILQLDQIKHAEMKIQIKREYFKRVRAILQTQLSGKHKILSINSLAIPVVRYSGGIIQWSQSELAEVDTKTRKLLTCHRGFAKLSDVDRLYVDRKDGGRGLISAADCIHLEEASIGKYRETNSNPILQVIGFRTEQEVIDKTKIQKERKEKWLAKTMHGQYMRQLPETIDKHLSFQWLANGKLSIETEGFICAAQDQAIHTKAMAKHIFKTTTNSECRVCGKSTETVIHIAVECSPLAPTFYLERHNAVARYIHFRLMKIGGFHPTEKLWYRHQPKKVEETEICKILWDFDIHTDHHIAARRPDILVVFKNLKQGLIIDVNCPNDLNVPRNEIEKCTKYTDLKIELERMWNIQFKVVPIVIGAMGAVSLNLPKFMKHIGLHPREIKIIQDSVIKSTCSILRKFLTQSGHSPFD